MTSSELWTREAAQGYDDSTGHEFEPEVIAATAAFLHELAGSRPALEFAVGTGRIALPLLDLGTPVQGMEYSPALVDRLREKVSAERLPVLIGDMATAQVDGDFALVRLVINTISNLRTQAEQVECFRNARHLRPGGRFVIELWMPMIRRMGPGPQVAVTSCGPGSIGYDTHDLATQECTSQGFTMLADGTVRHGIGRFRFAWPGELDLMAQLAGLELEGRHVDWDRSPFTGESPKHVSVWRKPAATQ